MADIRWPVSPEVFERFNQIAFRLLDLVDPNCDEAWALRDEARSLPGFPRGYDEERDTIVPVVTQTSYSGLVTPIPRGLRL